MMHIKRNIIPYWKDAIGLGSVVCDTKSKNAMAMANNLLMANLSSTR
jgi:hypothetical protein